MKHVTTTKGTELAVLDEGHGAPVVFVHGFPLDHSMWNGQIAALRGRCRTIAPDQRGFGRSQPIPGTAAMEQLADDVAGLLDALGVAEPVVFCGLSMGGAVAFQFWKRHRPKLRALVICNARANGDTPEGVAMRMKLADQTLADGAAPVAESMVARLFAPPSHQRIPQAIEAMRRVMLAASPEGIAAGLRGLASRPDVSDWLPKIDVPTLVIAGEHDVISPPEEMRSIAQAIPGAQFVLVAGAGHMTPVEQPEAVNAALLAFLTRLESRAG